MKDDQRQLDIQARQRLARHYNDARRNMEYRESLEEDGFIVTLVTALGIIAGGAGILAVIIGIYAGYL